ncbi:MAG: hypothetical protein R3C56_19140 [Pirellulaceae bacterium]
MDCVPAPGTGGFVDRRFNGPARVSGSSSAGKTVVAIHRAAEALKSNQGHVLLTTFSDDGKVAAAKSETAGW